MIRHNKVLTGSVLKVDRLESRANPFMTALKCHFEASREIFCWFMAQMQDRFADFTLSLSEALG